MPAPQEELEAYDKYQRELEDRLDDLTQRYINAKKRLLEGQAGGATPAPVPEADAGARPAGRAAGVVPGAVEVDEGEYGDGEDAGTHGNGTATPSTARGYGGAGVAAGAGKEETRALRAEVEALRRQNEELRGSQQRTGRVDALERERDALKTILEQRMKSLVEEMSSNIEKLPVSGEARPCARECARYRSA